MKLMTPVLIALISLSAFAQQQPPLDPARQAERDARDRDNRDNRGGGRDDRNNRDNRDNRGPGRDDRDNRGGGGWNRPPQPPPPMRPQPPRPPMPPPGYNNDYGPSYTARWQDYGLTKLPKVASQDINIDVRGQYVNEILLRAVDNTAQITSVLAYLSNGQVVDVRQATGNLGDGREIRAQLDYRGSLRVERIVVTATSPNLFGSRGQVQVILGLAN